MVFWRISLPVLRRTINLERLVQLMAAPASKVRDPRLEDLSVRAAGRLWRSSDGPCLERSLALHRVLGREGANPILACGMARVDDSLVGHAWVEVDERALVDANDPNGRYTVVARYSADGRRLTGSEQAKLDAAKNR
jgi:Transglutaminase-like superfamily